MGIDAIMLIVVGIFIVIFGIYLFVNKSKGTSETQKPTQKKQQTETGGYKGNTKEIEKKDMSSFIHFDKIANDMIYQKNGERYTMVIECKGINYELMSEIEQMAVEEGFITFLNTLKFPIQLYVQTRSIDLNENIKLYKERVTEFENKRQDVVAKYNQAEDDIDSTEEEINELKQQKVRYSNIAEYVADITKYVERLSLNKYLLQRKYYVILSYNKGEIATTEKFTKEEYEELCYRELYTRAQGIIGSLLACSVQGRVLTSNELAELIYISINKDDEKALSIKEALDSGFYRLYSTSDDVRQKRQEMLDEEIKKISLKRIEAAIKEGIAKGTIITETQFNDEVDKKIDKNALRMVESSGLNAETKEEVKNIIMTNRKDRLAKRKEEREKEQEKQQIEQQDIVQEQQVSETEDKIQSQESVELQPEIVIESQPQENVVVKQEVTAANETEDESIV